MSPIAAEDQSEKRKHYQWVEKLRSGPGREQLFGQCDAARLSVRPWVIRKVSANALKYDSTAKRDPSGSMSDPVP